MATVEPAVAAPAAFAAVASTLMLELLTLAGDRPTGTALRSAALSAAS